MKSFFTIVFGGLTLIFVGLGLFAGGVTVWRSLGQISQAIPHNTASAFDAVHSLYATSTRTQMLRYSAVDEEDAINSAVNALPKTGVKQVMAHAYLVKNLTTDNILFQENADQLLPIASVTKLVTAVMVQKLIPTNTHITITKSVMKTYGNTAEFKAGETFSANDLLYPLIMVSSNDAAEALAQSYGRAKFIQAMNDFAQSIGAYRTYFADPSGLDPKNVSTVNDLALILNWIRIHNPSIIALTELKTMTVRNHIWVNPTHFLSWSYYIGGKNGYLPEANRTNASLFKIGKNEDVYAIIVLGSANRDADTLKLLQKIRK